MLDNCKSILCICEFLYWKESTPMSRIRSPLPKHPDALKRHEAAEPMLLNFWYSSIPITIKKIPIIITCMIHVGFKSQITKWSSKSNAIWTDPIIIRMHMAKSQNVLTPIFKETILIDRSDIQGHTTWSDRYIIVHSLISIKSSNEDTRCVT